MITFQDFLKNTKTENEKQEYILSAIQNYKNSEMYKRAYKGYKYYCLENLTILAIEKFYYTGYGEKVKDIISPNHKCANGLFREFIRQVNECLLSNGINYKNPKTKDKIGGANSDLVIKRLGKWALWGGVSFGFLNLDHIHPFSALEFVPLYDEETGALMAGIYFWQIDDGKPLRVTLYEIDGYTDYIFNLTDETPSHKILTPKRPYKINNNVAAATGAEILNGENYSTLPIIPYWGNPEHQSELTETLQNCIDAYDMIMSGFANIVDETSEIYWVLRNVGGMDESSAVQTRDAIKRLKMAFAKDTDGDIQAQTIDIPSNAREVALDRLKQEMYTSFGAVDYTKMSTHGATATEIEAAYTSLNAKVSEYEACTSEFISGILKLLNIDDSPSFTREKIVNTSEEIDNVLKCAEHLPQTYITKKLLTLLGDIDQLDEVMKELTETEVERFEDEK